jgi:flagellar hook-associated protein 2
VTVDGGSTQNVTLNSNLSNAEGVRADIQGKLTGLTVTLDASDKLVFTSNTSGAASSIAISGIGGSEGTQLGLSNADGTPGTTSTAYTINGAAAIADATGNIITGAVGSAVDGLSLEILGGATGNLGTVDHGIGIGAQLETMIKALLDTDGILNARVTGLNTSVADISKQRTVLEARASALEARYRAQFNGLETIISNLTATQSFLTTALSQFVDPLSFKK